MDPSNPYYDPNRESYPAQNTTQQNQVYYPPMQGPYPQQNYPTIQNTSYSGYNPNNTIQYIPYAQQPQPIYMPQSNLSDLDNGCYVCYKVLLWIYMILLVLQIINIITVFSAGDYGYYYFLFIMDLVMVILPIIFIVIQLQAISERSLSKAKTALIGFIIYLIVDPTYVFGVTYAYLGYIPDELLVQDIIGYVIFIFAVLIGSIQVYQFLKKHFKPVDGYQTMHNTA